MKILERAESFEMIQRASKSVLVGPGQVGTGQFIILNVSASLKMVKKLYFNFFPIFRVVLMSLKRPIYFIGNSLASLLRNNSWGYRLVY